MGLVTHGMDPAEVDALGASLQAKAEALDAIVDAIDAKVRSTSWIGSDADLFKHTWWPAHRGQVARAAADVRGLGQSARNNAAEQLRASDAGSGIVSGPGGGAIGSASGPASGDAAFEQRLNALLDSAKDLEFIRSTYGLTQGELDDAVKLLKSGGVVRPGSLPVVGLLVSAADVGVNAGLYGWGDGRTMFAEVDGFMGVVLTPVPGGPMAWSIGTKIGEQASYGLDWIVKATTGDTPAGHIVSGQLDQRSPGGSFDALSPDQQVRVAAEVSQRYEGWSGLRNFMVDAVSGG